jgi:hypothetical protein
VTTFTGSAVYNLVVAGLIVAVAVAVVMIFAGG